MRETDRQIGREGKQEGKCIWRNQRWTGGRGGWMGEGCIVTGGVEKREGHLYIVIDIQLVGAHEHLGFTHN